jgi:hypothetical protein
VVFAHLEFTEWPDKIDITKYSKSVLNKWIIANSSHVIDLFFHLIGKPTELIANQSGSIAWHSNGSKFWGSGVSNRSVTFDYYSDWNSDGSWKIKLKTKNKILILKPLEELNIISDEGIILKPELDDYYDRLFKPGLYKMMKDFLENDGMLLCSMEEQIEMFDTYYAIGDYVE